MRIELQCDIAAPIERVFAYLSEDDLRRLWTPGLEEISYPTGQRPAEPVGTRFTQRLNDGGELITYQGEFTEWEPPRRLGLLVGPEGYSFAVQWHLMALGTGTRLHYQATLRRAGWWYRLCACLTQGMVTHQMRLQLRQLKLLAESTLPTDLHG